MGAQLEVVASLLRDKKIELEIDGVKVTADLTFAGTNDIPAQAAQCGLQGVSSACPCNWCTIHRNYLMSPDADIHRNTFPIRTIESLGVAFPS